MQIFNLGSVQGACPKHPLHYFEKVDSTQDEALRLKRAGCPSGTIVIADEQMHGRGRHGHSWHAERGVNLLFTEVILPDPAKSREKLLDLRVLTLALGIGVHEAISRLRGLCPDIRWPNDVLISGKKVAGILVEMVEDSYLAGIGINVNGTSFPSALTEEATSLHLELGFVVNRESLLISILKETDAVLETLYINGKQDILQIFAERSSYARFGKRVRVDVTNTNSIIGTTQGINEWGFLIVQDDTGKEHIVLSGGVRPA